LEGCRVSNPWRRPCNHPVVRIGQRYCPPSILESKGPGPGGESEWLNLGHQRPWASLGDRIGFANDGVGSSRAGRPRLRARGGGPRRAHESRGSAPAPLRRPAPLTLSPRPGQEPREAQVSSEAQHSAGRRRARPEVRRLWGRRGRSRTRGRSALGGAHPAPLGPPREEARLRPAGARPSQVAAKPG
jgi:hypothetical protein